ncbi:MAG: carboxypeptidase-like regulatory domain-containing protein, partial [Planctomycetota bacterium]
ADIESQLGRAEPRMQTDLSGELWIQLPARWTLAHVEVSAGEERLESVVQIWPGRLSEVTLRFPGDYRVKGRVLMADGTPVPRPSITAVQLLEDGSEQIYLSGGDQKGEFELDLPTPGRVRVLASKGAMGAGREEVVLTVDRRTATLEVTLPVAGEITGRLLNEDGSPISGIPVSCIPLLPYATFENLDSNVRIGEILRDTTARSDAEGRFRLAGVSLDYDFVLWCRPVAETPGREMYHGPVRGGDHVELVVSETAMNGGIIRGTVELAETGEPPDYFEVGVIEDRPLEWAGSKPNLEVKLPFREGNGVLEIDQLVPGRSYYLNVTGPDLGVSVVGPIEAGSFAVVPVQLQPQSRLELEVIAPSGLPARNATVQLAFWPPFLEDGVRKGIAGLAGELALDFVSAGVYRVEVTFAGRRYRSEDIRVPPGETYEHTIQLDASMEER